MVIPPKTPLSIRSLILLFFLIIFFVFRINGIKRKILKIFLKKACSIGWINSELNFIKAERIEKRKQEVINNIIGNIFNLNYSVLQFSFNYVNKNNGL
jgi:hypothetical protein